MPAAAKSNSSSHIMAHIFLAVGLGAAVGFAGISDDWIAAGFVILVTLAAYFGYWSGVVKIAASVLGILAAIRFAGPFSPLVADYSDRLFDVPERFRGLISIGCAGVLVAIVVIVSLRIAGHVIFRSNPQLRVTDRWMGAAIGAIQGVIISAMILFAAMMLEPIAAKHVTSNSEIQSFGVLDQLPSNIVSFTQLARQSSVGTLMDAMVPWQDGFNERVQKLTETIVTNNGDDASLQQALKQLVEDVRNDPNKQKSLSSQSGIDEQTLRSILDSSEFEEAIGE